MSVKSFLVIPLLRAWHVAAAAAAGAVVRKQQQGYC